MNAGMGVEEIVADMTYPAELFDHPWMVPSYGAPEYIVRDLFREENGWWDRNPTTLHPASAERRRRRGAVGDRRRGGCSPAPGSCSRPVRHSWRCT